MTTGSEFRARREQAGLTQQEAAERLGVALRTIGNWERGNVIPQRHWAGIEEMFDEEARWDAAYPSAIVVTERAPRARDASQLATIVRERRLDRGWGKEEAARRAGLSSITWKRIEDAERVQDASMAKALAVLDITDADLQPAPELPAASVDALRNEHAAQAGVGDETLVEARSIVNAGTRVVEKLSALSGALREERSPHAATVFEVIPDVLEMWFAGMKITGVIHPLRDVALQDPQIMQGLQRQRAEHGDSGTADHGSPDLVLLTPEGDRLLVQLKKTRQKALPKAVLLDSESRDLFVKVRDGLAAADDANVEAALDAIEEFANTHNGDWQSWQRYAAGGETGKEDL